MTEQICGYSENRDKPCQRQPGWGVEDDQDNPEGLCRDHLAEADGMIGDLKKDFIEELKSEVRSISDAASQIDKSTIHRWRKNDPEFDQKVREAKEHQKDMRVEKVEDAVFSRIMSGDAAASETIFWLKNNADWEDDPRVQVNQQQSQGQSQSVPDNLEELVDEGVQIARQGEGSDGENGQKQRQKH